VLAVTVMSVVPDVRVVNGPLRVSANGTFRHGATQTNEAVVFYVAAGGRVLQAPPYPSTNGSPAAAFAFGQFTQTCFQDGCTPSSNEPIVAGSLSGGSKASGKFANGPQGCGQTDWSAEAG
jgi:hypothetical protein